MTDTPDRNMPDSDPQQLEVVASANELEQQAGDAAERFRRNAQLLCAGSVDVAPFEYGARDER